MGSTTAVENQPKTQRQDSSEAVVHQRQGSRLIGRILPIAVKLWLQSQAEQIEGLAFDLEGTDRQILSGHVPGVSVSAQRAVYQGIHVSQVQLAAQQVHFNLGQVLRGKPLRLLKGFLMEGQVRLTEADLNDSLKAAYLAEGVENFWQTLLALPDVVAEIVHYYGRAVTQLDWHDYQSIARIEQGHLTLSWGQTTAETAELAVALRSQLQVQQNRFLTLHRPCWLKSFTAIEGYPSEALAGFQWDLGSEACLRELSLGQGFLACAGQVLVKP